MSQAERPVVALLTDFGASAYVGIMKGVILAQAPGAALVDLTHDVPAHQVRQGAWLLATAVPWLPAGSVVMGVVDPGVGTERQAVAAVAGNYRFVGPDNGLLWPAVESMGGPEVVVALPVPESASTTFHGRDVFAPAAGRLAAGRDLASLGSGSELRARLTFYREGRAGEVVHVDPFGNLVTNLPPAGPPAARYRLAWEGGSRRLPLLPTYGAAATLGGEPFLVVGSAGTLEISRYRAAAGEVLPLAAGDRLTLEPG